MGKGPLLGPEPSPILCSAGKSRTQREVHNAEPRCCLNFLFCGPDRCTCTDRARRPPSGFRTQCHSCPLARHTAWQLSEDTLRLGGYGSITERPNALHKGLPLSWQSWGRGALWRKNCKDSVNHRCLKAPSQGRKSLFKKQPRDRCCDPVGKAVACMLLIPLPAHSLGKHRGNSRARPLHPGGRPQKGCGLLALAWPKP